MQDKFQVLTGSHAVPTQQILGGEPDALFLEESWTFGVPAAIEKLRRRQQQQAERNRQIDAPPNLGSMTSNVLASPAWTPADWVPADQLAHRQLPHGWMPADAAPANEPAPQPQSIARDATLARACQLLGVTPTASREQIRSAYRRLVSQCHPDRHQRANDAVRDRATQQMADLNQAYRLLRSSVLEDAA